MRELPILFSGPMVRAILDGRKTQTRRVAKPQPVGRQRVIKGLGHVTVGMNPADDGAVWYVADGIGPGTEIRCPFGVPGDRLWVRETWGEVSHIDWGDPTKYEFVHVLGPDERNIIYWEEASRHGFEWVGEGESDRWRPSIHMPRWASRITLEVVSVRVERLADISEADAIAEGIERTGDGRWRHYLKPDYAFSPDPRESFSTLWDSMYGRGPWAWKHNPWVWAVEFRRVKP